MLIFKQALIIARLRYFTFERAKFLELKISQKDEEDLNKLHLNECVIEID